MSGIPLENLEPKGAQEPQSPQPHTDQESQRKAPGSPEPGLEASHSASISPDLLAAQLALASTSRSPYPSSTPILMASSAQAEQIIQSWKGPYPPPEAIERYERLLPGAFDRMIKMAEQLQAAQIEDSRLALTFTQQDARRGHWLGFTIALLAVVGAVATAALGFPWLSALFLGVPLLAVAQALILSTRREPAPQIIEAVTKHRDAGTPNTVSAD
jgi:uncharacterized membrane protein